MTRFSIACAHMAALTLSAFPVQLLGGNQPKVPSNNASEADRKDVAELIREAFAREAAKMELAGSADERHKIEKKIRIDFPKVEQTFVTYWRSSVSARATIQDPEKKLVV